VSALGRLNFWKAASPPPFEKRQPVSPGSFSGTTGFLFFLVYARHGHELIGLKSLVREFIMCNITEVLAKSKCDSVRNCAEEACSKIMSRRTETSYKAKPLDELARHSKIHEFRRYGK